MRMCAVRGWTTVQREGAHTSSTGRPVRCDMYPRIEKTTTPARKDVAQLISGTSLQ